MSEDKKSLNFIEHIIENDLRNGFSSEKLRFRFPPEPNGYLHIGHAAAICLNFGLGIRYNSPVNLRFDDTNPAKEEQEYVDAIKNDIKWLGFNWDKECYSSDYFQQLYDWTVELIKKGLAYVDSQTSEEIARQKGTPTSVGENSPYRNRSVEENLDLFQAMKNGDFKEGEHVLRAKIDMQSTNMLLRDPLMYRVLYKTHHRTNDDWCIYPMYDWTHGESDYIEQISHSFCTLEFKPHRPLYEWFLEQVYDENLVKPKQREFARRNLSFTVMSKRKLLKLVEQNIVSGWDDPRMPTISGLRRRGYSPASIRKFSEISGISKRDNVTDVSLLEFCVREDLNKTANRVMSVLNPVKVVITNYPDDKEEFLTTENNPEDKNAGFREIPFSKELYIEREDFKEQANKKYFRLSLGKEVRLKSAYIIKANDVVKDENNNILEIHCTYDADSKSGSGSETSLRKVKGTLHWVSIKHAIKAEVRVYDRLFSDESPDSHKEKDFMDFINPKSLEIIKNAFVEPSLKNAKIGERFQFQRLGYFTLDKDSSAENLIFNKTVGLKDTWKKVQEKDNKKNDPNAEFKKTYIEITSKAGKYFKERNADKKNEILKHIASFANSISVDTFIDNLNKAEFKKEYLTNFVLLNNLDNSISENEKVISAVKTGLKQSDAYIKSQVITYLLKNSELQKSCESEINQLKSEEKNEYILGLLKDL